MKGIEQPSSLNNPATGKWACSLRVPIQVDSPLIATFCTSIVARLYTLLTRIKVSGAWCDSFNLEVPLQIINSRTDASRMNALPLTEETRFEELRWGSMSQDGSGSSVIDDEACMVFWWMVALIDWSSSRKGTPLDTICSLGEGLLYECKMWRNY